jgi:diguanylate cyclase (GGDEF)-like protein/excisionase family DNA binding protein
MLDQAIDPRPAQPGRLTVSVAGAARLLGVHPNTVRAWSDRGILRHHRINARGDRRFRRDDLERFLAELRHLRPGAVSAGQAGVSATVDPAEAAAAETDARGAVARAEALRRIALDLGGRLDLEAVLDALVEHAVAFFDADRVAIYLPAGASGRFEPRSARGLSAPYLAVAADPDRSFLVAEALAARAPRMSSDVATDPREAGIREAAMNEGVATRCIVPLVDRGAVLGLLDLYFDRGRPGSPAGLAGCSDFASHASVAIRTARDYGQMARWTAQLASIQQLGARLSRLSSVREIGEAIASGLSELIDHHNVRVYRRYGDDLVPVAMRGRVGEYVDETPDQLRTKVGLGLTGWVAEHRVAQIVGDAAHDPRALTIPGTDADLPESMLLAPMLHEDDVLGVLVLSKLGLHQFTDDDLRLLVIYASFAAQAMANADATERLRAQSAALERQLLGQRELLRITESILATLDPRAVLDQVADGLAAIIGYDRITIALMDAATGTLRPLAAKGLAAGAPETWDREARRLALRVVRENTARLVAGAAASGPGSSTADGRATLRSLIVAPLRGRSGATGILMLERSRDRGYTPDEFELVKVFAAQVSIALQNAEAHRAVALRAQTDALTGLLNHGTFQEWLARLVEGGEPFGLLMLDLDDFKAVNDALGHQAGDRYLRDIAAALPKVGRETDWVFRYGGDEFAILLRGADMAGTLAAAARIRDAVLAVGGPGSEWARLGLSVSCSIGAATFPADGRTADEVLLAADRACFVAKRSGSGRIATAAEREALAGEIALQIPTPVDPPSLPVR